MAPTTVRRSGVMAEHRFDPQSLAAGTYLVTGAAGFIGQALCQAIAVRGGHVVGVDLRPPAAPLPDGARFVACDLRERAAFEAVLRQTGPLAGAVHLAAKLGDWGSRTAFAAINVHATRAVLEALHDAACARIVHVSTIAAMGFDPGESARGDSLPVLCDDPYSDTKAEGEEVARGLIARGAPIAIVRPGDVYGLGSEPWVERPLRMIEKGQMLFVGGGDGHFAHTHVDNVVHALLLALDHPAAVGRCWLAADGPWCTYRAYFTRLAEAAGLPVPTRSVPRAVGMALGATLEAAASVAGFTPPITRMAVRYVTKMGSYDIAPTVAALGYTPKVTLDEGMRRIAQGLQWRREATGATP
ncbi:MAG: NAD(P)-dependent oxidoreductase [Myxococcales bacterium]|nr:NAD(P)-dependent oxidoreductase [Myxococcales bacterium]